jgi:hypothetical protein
MKTIVLSLITLLSFQAVSQIQFGLGLYQNFGNIYARNSNYAPSKINLNRSTTGASLTLSKIDEQGWYPELKVDISFISDTSRLFNGTDYSPIEPILYQSKTTESISVPYVPYSIFYKTSHQQISFTLNRKVSKYFSLGSGIAFDIRKTIYADLTGSYVYNWEPSLDAYGFSISNLSMLDELEYTLTTATFILPFNFRFHLPLENSEVIFSNSFNLMINQNPTYQSSIFFRF